MFRVYLLIFWIPAVASLVLISVSWGESSRPYLQLLWFAVAVVLQIIGGIFSPVWVVGLVLQAVLAVYLAIRWRLS